MEVIQDQIKIILEELNQLIVKEQSEVLMTMDPSQKIFRLNKVLKIYSGLTNKNLPL